MRILLVILHADASRGGAEAYTVTLFHKLLEAGHDVWLAAATFEGGVPRDRRVPLRHTGLSRLRRYRRFLEAERAHLEANDYDVIHSMLPAYCTVYQPQAGLERANVRRASLWRKLSNERQHGMAFAEKQLLNGPETPLVLCLSERARCEAAALFPAAAGRMVTFHLGVDDARFTPAPPRPAAAVPVCLFVGQDFWRKGLDTAIRAVAKHPTAILRVVGGDDRRSFAGIIAECRVGDRVQFLGATRDVVKQFHDADLLILPTHHEPYGMVVIEAMLCGVPPIISANAGAAEVVHDGADGRVVSGFEPADWAAAIDQVLGERAAMSAACLSRREELSYSHHLRTLLGLYERARAERPAEHAT